jgi:uncharacterized protein (DUF302 family)
MEKTSYTYRTKVDLSYTEAVDRVVQELQKEGFSVLTEIDIKAKLKQKLGVDFRRYVILGACNPPLAHRALRAEIDVGTLLPCNVVVYEDGPRRSVVAAMAPQAALALVDNDELAEIATEADRRIGKVIDALEVPQEATR